jgi:secreted trypsin-like serine protease
MKSFVILFAIISIAVARDYSNVRPIHELPEWRDAHKELLQYFPIQTKSVGGRIVNGHEATPNQFPYQVALFMWIGQGTGLCGGSIVSQHFVLTAAHCLDIDGIDLVVVSKGAHELTNANEVGRIDTTVFPHDFIIHEAWDASVLQNDIALLRIVSGISFSASIQPVRLPHGPLQNQNFAGDQGQISGWGRFSDVSEDVASHLRWGTSNIMANTLCNVMVLGILHNSHICIDGRVGSATCQGDSGGPLTVVQGDGSSLQVGVVSFGVALGCELRFPSVFSRITSFISWLEHHTGGEINHI